MNRDKFVFGKKKIEYLGFLSSLRNGAITSVLEKAHDTCSTSPNQDLIPEMFSGLGKFRMLFISSSPGSTPFSVNRKPRYSITFLPKTNLSRFMSIPPFPHNVRYSQVLKNSFFKSKSQMIESSTRRF